MIAYVDTASNKAWWQQLIEQQLSLSEDQHPAEEEGTADTNDEMQDYDYNNGDGRP